MHRTRALESGALEGQIAIRVSPDDEASARRLIIGFRSEFCRTETDFAQALRNPALTGVVWEHSRRLITTPEVARAVRERASHVSVLLRAELHAPGAATDLVAFARDAGNLTVSLVDYDDFTSGLVRWLDHLQMSTPEHYIIRRIGPFIPAGASAPFIAAAIMGKARARVTDLARICGGSTRNLELRLEHMRLPPPRDLLGWMLSLHTTWRLQFEGQSLKMAASIAGYATSAQLSNHVLCHVGDRPTVLVRAGGFWSLLDRFAAVLEADR